MRFDPRKKLTKVSPNDLKEAFRETGGGKAASQGISGEIKPGGSIDLTDLAKNSVELEQYWERFYRQAERVRKEEKALNYDSKEQLTCQIRALQEELERISKATENLEKEVEIAAFQAPVEPGIYHLSFFEKLRQFIKVFRTRIEDSAAWLAAFNARSKKRNAYWAQVSKSGTKFMLSGERYMATQAG